MIERYLFLVVSMNKTFLIYPLIISQYHIASVSIGSRFHVISSFRKVVFRNGVYSFLLTPSFNVVSIFDDNVILNRILTLAHWNNRILALRRNNRILTLAKRNYRILTLA
jgi:hypothetical protein